MIRPKDIAPPRPLILFHTRVFGAEAATRLDPDVGCDFTNDIRRAAEADAVVFHIPDLRHRSGIARYPQNAWVAWSSESAVNYPALSDPLVMRQFDIRMTYHRDADIWCPSIFASPDSFARLADEPVPVKTEAAPLVLFQSAPIDRAGRYAFAFELMRHVRTDSYGKLLRTRALDGPDRGAQTKLDVIRRYKFCLAIENSIAPDYVTEKFFDPLLAGTVPVYRGAPNVAEFAPGAHSFIDANDFRGPRELAEYLTHLSTDEAAYGAYFTWRKNPARRFVANLERIEEPAFSQLGRLVADRLTRLGRPTERRRPTYPFSRLNRVRRFLSERFRPAN